MVEPNTVGKIVIGTLIAGIISAGVYMYKNTPPSHSRQDIGRLDEFTTEFKRRVNVNNDNYTSSEEIARMLEICGYKEPLQGSLNFSIGRISGETITSQTHYSRVDYWIPYNIAKNCIDKL